MLPPGHIAAGYLTSELVLRTLHFDLSAQQANQLVWWGMLFSFIPDLDMFYAFSKVGKMRIENDKGGNHRLLYSHAPILWLAAGLIIFFSAQSPYYKAFGILLWLCSWSHFILDSEWGIMWLWPFSKRFLPFSQKFYERKYLEHKRESDSFIKYWSYLIKDYYFSLPGLIEILLILIALGMRFRLGF